MAVVSVDGTKADEALERWIKRQKTYFGSSSERSLRAQAAWGFVRKDRKGAITTLVLEQPDGTTKSVEVAADLGPRYLPRLPVPKAGVADSAHVSWTKLDGSLGYIYVRRIRQGLEASLDKAVRDLGDIKGLVLDLRGNSGGGFDTSTAFVNFDASPAAGTDRPQIYRPDRRADRRANRQRRRGLGVVVLGTKAGQVFRLNLGRSFLAESHL